MRLSRLRTSMWFAVGLIAIASAAVYYSVSSTRTELPTVKTSGQPAQAAKKTDDRVRDFITPYKGPAAPLGTD